MSPASFKDAFDHAVIGMALVNPEGQWLLVNPSLCGILGFTEMELLPRAFQDFTHPDDLETDLASIRQLLAGEIFSYQAERRYRRRSGPYVWVLQSVSLVRDDDGLPLYFIFQIEDITHRKAAEAELRQAHADLRARVDELERRTQEMALVGEMGELLQSCRTVAEAHRIIGRMMRQLFPQESGALCLMNSGRSHLEALVTWGSGIDTETYFPPEDCWSLRRNRLNIVGDPEVDLPCQHVRPTAHNYACLPLLAGREALGVLYLHRGHTALDEAALQLARAAGEQIALALANLQLQETLRNQSVRDGLTGLYNRRYLQESLEREINRATRTGRPVAVIISDVDHFKKFNDTHGHEAGDAVLVAVANLFLTKLRKADIPCRFGGEEFVLILPEANLEDAAAKAESLRAAVRELEITHDRDVLGRITLSLGVAAFPEHGAEPDLLLKLADEALYEAKRGGRDQVVCARGPAPEPQVQPGLFDRPEVE
jgi:diguanylate cyclase (GGDEF)-like protein/PAS domain S-box-containing protein